MKARTILVTTLAILFTIVLQSPIKAQSDTETPEPDKVIEMKGNDNLDFTVENIEARPGQVIKVKLTTVSDFSKEAMAHNFVLVALDASPRKVAIESAQAYENNYIAADMEDAILAHTGLAGDGETVSVTFTVPEKPGDYPYICTFPGHFSGGMKGTLSVSSGKASL